MNAVVGTLLQCLGLGLAVARRGAGAAVAGP